MVELYFKEKPTHLERLGSADPLEVEAVKHSRWGWKVKVENETDAYWALHRGQATLLSPESLRVCITIPGGGIGETYYAKDKEAKEPGLEPDTIAPEEV